MTPEREQEQMLLDAEERRKARLLQAAATIYTRRYAELKESVLTAFAIESLIEREIR